MCHFCQKNNEPKLALGYIDLEENVALGIYGYVNEI